LVLGCGASTKGNVVIQYADLTAHELPAIMERYPQKVGLVTPGSRIPIISEEDGRARKPDYLIVFPWHFRDEITRREQDFLAAGGQLVFPLP
ncbi:methyltransferase C-terminal domain-containing protein, partial [Bacillus cereus group sp. BC326]|uniref:methyltransferase C-terminal domain-containing protein n=1 Tax=Bacillus cereus group sp. BC326 TaxID=3445310 RepID=UPI003F266EF6